MQNAVTAAERVAAAVLLPDAAAVDAASAIPSAHLAALDDAGLTGLAADRPTLATRVDVAGALAGGCLATAFVWLQHQGALAAAVASDAGPWIAPLASGRVRAGVVITAVLGPTPLRLHDGRLTGSARWVTGWGLVDLLRVAAVDDDGRVVTAFVDVGPGMRATPAPLVAANASSTVTLAFDGVPVPQDRVLGAVTLDEWRRADAAGLAGNGGLALGVARRAARDAESDPLLAEVDAVRGRLLTADTDALPEARAACSALAVRAAAALAVHDGGGGVIRGSRADRLAREAHFLLGFGSRPAIRAALLQQYSGA